MAKQIRTIADLTPDSANVNKGTERGHYLIDYSITELGAGRSILADADGVVVAGNKTLEVAADHQLPVRVVQTDGSELVVVQRTDLRLTGNGAERDRARKLAIADNRASEVGYSADVEILLEHAQSGVDLSAMYRQDELDALLEGLTPAGMGGDGEAQDTEPQIDRAAELNKKWKVKRGDLWLIGEHRLLCGDSTKSEDVARVMNGEKADIGMHDPPYGINAPKMTLGTGKKDFVREDFDSEAPNVQPLLGLSRHCAIWGGNYFADQLPVNNEWLCWHKKNDGLSFSEFELAWSNFGLNTRHLSHHWSGEEKNHPTQKPEPVIRWALALIEGNIVIDCYAGSGTTGMAAENLGRKSRMIERSSDYCAVILERMATAFPSLDIRQAT